MKKSIICLMAAISVFLCSTFSVSASDEIYDEERLYPGKSIQESSEYMYGDKIITITLPYNKIRTESVGEIIIEDMIISTVLDNDETVSGSVGTDSVDLTIDSGDSFYSVSYSDMSIVSEGLESGNYVFTGSVSFSKLYNWLPDYTQIQNCDVAKVYMRNFGYTESVVGDYGTIDSYSYVTDSYGVRIDLADGYNYFYYNKPGSSINITTVVNFSVVVPYDVSSGMLSTDVQFVLKLTSNTPDGDYWSVTPLLRYTDYSDLMESFWTTMRSTVSDKIVILSEYVANIQSQLAGNTSSFWNNIRNNLTTYIKGIYNNLLGIEPHFWTLFDTNLSDVLDRYWSEDNPVTSEKVNTGVNDYIAIENEISDSSFATVKDFDVNLYKFENMDSNFVTSVLWITTIMNSIFNNISGYNTVFVITCALLFACVLVGLSRLWK